MQTTTLPRPVLHREIWEDREVPGATRFCVSCASFALLAVRITALLIVGVVDTLRGPNSSLEPIQHGAAENARLR